MTRAFQLLHAFVGALAQQLLPVFAGALAQQLLHDPALQFFDSSAPSVAVESHPTPHLHASDIPGLPWDVPHE